MQLPACLQVFSDENVNNFHMPVIISSVYFLVILSLAPAYMKNRPPLKLKKLIVVYNLFQVVANLYLATSLSVLFFPYLKYQCGILRNIHFTKMWEDIRWAVEGIYLLKVLDLFDTLFFVLCKKNKNVSFLHVYHHGCMIILFYFSVATYSAGFTLGFGITVNCYVHSVMYLYYGLASLGPKAKKYLWWKRYLTIIQMIQFVVIMTVMIVNSMNGCEDFGKIYYIIFGYVFTLLLLFVNYYKHAFKSKSSEKYESKKN